MQCHLSKNIQGILEKDLAWKHELEALLHGQQDQIASLQKTVDSLVRHSRSDRSASPSSSKRRRIGSNSPSSRASIETGTHSSSTIPSSSEEISQSVLPVRASKQRETDIISRRLLSVEEAASLLSLYLSQMDHQLFHIVRMSHNLNPNRRPGVQLQEEIVKEWIEELRNSSSLLLLSVLSVAALHVPQLPNQPHRYTLVYKEFIRLAAMQAFSQQQTLDDLRALTIGAFWLPEVSWILSGTAVRVATEQGLHLSYKRTPLSFQAYEEARLYYLVYLVDHQASITPHGRPPMTRQHAVIRKSSQWLLSTCNAHGVRLDDQRLISQVKLWEILHDVVDLMGSDATLPLDEASLALEERFSTALKEWLKESSLQISWCFTDSPGEAEKHLAELRLHFRFAFLFLESAAFRAVPGTQPDFLQEKRLGRQMESRLLSSKRAMAERAMQTAEIILDSLRSSPSTPQDLATFGTWDLLRYGPAYAYSMVISTIVFVAKVQESGTHNFGGSSLPQTLDRINQVLSEARKFSEFTYVQHLVKKFVDGSHDLLKNLNRLTRQSAGIPSPSLSFDQQAQASGSNLSSSSNMSSISYMSANNSTMPNASSIQDIASLDDFNLLSNTHPISGTNLWSDIFENFESSTSESALGSLLDGMFDPGKG